MSVLFVVYAKNPPYPPFSHYRVTTASNIFSELQKRHENQKKKLELEFAEMDQKRREFEREKAEFDDLVRQWEQKNAPSDKKKKQKQSLF